MNLFYNTRQDDEPLDAPQAILRGLAPNKGLYTLKQMPTINPESVSGLGFIDLSKKILSSYLAGFSTEIIERCVDEAYSNRFDSTDIAPAVEVGNRVVVELFHGPTAAFKDIALSILPRLMSEAAKLTDLDKNIVILTATSGDTGSSAMKGFCNVPGIRCLAFFPDKGISPIQRAQMTTMEGDNILSCAIKGNFDDAQSGVKQIFSEIPEEFLTKNNLILSSANSINFGRLAPQIVYYYSSYLQMVRERKIKMGDKVNYVVPTGNFGDILAGFLAKLSGLPIGRLICASNSNNVLFDFFQTGTYDRNRKFNVTISPSMDILISSNLERLLFWAADCNSDSVRKYLDDLQNLGKFSLKEEELVKIRSTFSAEWVSENQTYKTIAQVFRGHGYLMDPHTAVAWKAGELYQRHTADNSPMVVLSTASPFKFPSSVLKSFDRTAILPDSAQAQVMMLQSVTGKKAPLCIGSLFGKQVRFQDLVKPDEMMAYVMDKEKTL